MPKALRCAKTLWQRRAGYALENDLVRLVALTSGGHVAEFRFGESALNPLWTPPWKLIDHERYDEKRHSALYGPPTEAKLICGIAGHNLCLDYFGPPSEDEARRGLPIHGEAPNLRWRTEKITQGARSAVLRMAVKLPAAGLHFTREIALRSGESVAYFTETVSNERDLDHFFQWTQHVTLGPPFLDANDSRIAISATRGQTSAHGYEGRELLQSGKDFRWPDAPGVDGKKVDLTIPFSRPGRGFISTVLMDPKRDQQFIAAINRPSGLIMGYCFSRRDFPWTAIWEENQARAGAPWKRRTQARGLEFGSTPFPVGRAEAFAAGPLFGVPRFSVVPARGRKTVHYLSFLARATPAFGDVRDVRVIGKEIHIVGSSGRDVVTLTASNAGQLQQ